MGWDAVSDEPQDALYVLYTVRDEIEKGTDYESVLEYINRYLDEVR